MADDRYRRTAANLTPPVAGAKRAATAAARQPGPDPLVELARLIGQNEVPAQDPHQVVRRREGPGAAAQRPVQRPQSPSQPSPSVQRQPSPPSQQPPDPTMQRRQAAPSQPPPSVQRQPTPPPRQPVDPATQRRQPAPSQPPPSAQRQPTPPPQPPPDRDAERGAQFERHPDQRYAGYTEPKPAASPPGRGQAGAAHAWQGTPPDLSDPYSTDAGWRPPPRPKERKAQPDNAAAFRPGYGADAKGPPDRAPPRAFEPAPPVASESRRPQAPAAGHHPRYEPPGEKAYAQAETYEDARAVADELGPQPDRYDEYDADGYSGRDYEEGSEPRSRKLWIVAAILALAVIGTAGAYSYRAMLGGDTQETATPVIRADQSPKKIAPASQPNGDKQIQERVGDRSAGERVVSREEQPLAIKDPNARALVPEPPSAASAPVTTELGSVQPPGLLTGTAGEPKKVRTVTIRPEGGPAEPTPAPAAPPRVTAPAAPAPARAARPAAPASPGEPQQAPARSQTALAVPPPRPSAGNYVVQLSAQKSEGDAQASFRAMQAKYPSVLGGRQAIIRRKEQTGKGVYFGAQVGPFASREEAVQLCESLKSAGGSCFVERN
ncbi:MAG: SPOR domain-containing protein [Rhodoplanes sp.]